MSNDETNHELIRSLSFGYKFALKSYIKENLIYVPFEIESEASYANFIFFITNLPFNCKLFLELKYGYKYYFQDKQSKEFEEISIYFQYKNNNRWVNENYTGRNYDFIIEAVTNTVCSKIFR
jgi:hypothetical protein